MLATYKTLMANQFEAAFCTLKFCVDLCPESSWNQPVGNNPFSQTVFHTLFFADFYLEQTEEHFREQAFHQQHAQIFADYEQLAPREPVACYEKSFIGRYLVFCRKKAQDGIASESEATLTGPSGFVRRNCTRAELHVYNMRHIQHHAAQLSLRLRIDAQIAIPWIASGWKNP